MKNNTRRYSAEVRERAVRLVFEHGHGHLSLFVEAVRAAAPRELCLRDQDRFLWARSFADQLKRDVQNNFGVEASEHA